MLIPFLIERNQWYVSLNNKEMEDPNDLYDDFEERASEIYNKVKEQTNQV